MTAALVSTETDGAVRALVGGLDYGESQFNRATAARRQPGSSFKVYIYALALETGEFTSRSVLRDQGVRCGNWSPKNYSGSYGSGRRVTMADALRVSLNTTAVSTSLSVGRDNVVKLVNRLGIDGPRASCSMALGDTGITPIAHVGGYATFANGGRKAIPYALLEVFNGQGEMVYSRRRDEPEPEQILSEDTVRQMNQMLVGVVEAGTGKAAQLEFTHAAGKTGTSSSYRDGWFMGYTGKLVTGVWVGRDDFRPVYRPGGRGLTGGSVPAQIWKSYMAVAHKSLDFPTLLGLDDHPAQIAERQRLAALRRDNPALNQPGEENQSGKLISTATLRVLEGLAGSLRSASGAAPNAAVGNLIDVMGRR
jgi:penicillin-binding protein 1A